MNYLNPIGLLSRLLTKLGLLTYLSKVELAAHIGWSIDIAFIGYYISFWSIPIWILFSLYDELFIDGHINLLKETKEQKIDFIWDILSKCLIPLIIGIILIV